MGRVLVIGLDRLTVLQLARAAIAAVAVIATALVDGLVQRDWPAAPALVAWLLVTTAADVARRRVGRGRGLGGPLLLVVVDALVLGALIANTGGHRSPLLGLVYLHVVTVSLVVSHRLALRVAVLHGSMLFAGYVLAVAETARLRLPTGMTAATAGRDAALHASGFLLVAVAVAALSALNERARHRAHVELSAIADVGAALSGTLDVDDVAGRAATSLRAALGADAVAVVVTDGDRVRAATSTATATTFRTSRSGDVDAAVHSLHAPVCVHRDLAWDDVLPGETNVIAVPFESGDERGAVLVGVGGGPRTRVPQTTVTTAANVARLVGTTLENARLHAHVERLATRDGLTGLANRRVFDDALAAEVRRARRTGEPFSLVLLDVDHFKAVNDVHGHQAGDEVLRRVAASLAGATRDVDLAARYGGEEFVVLLPACGYNDALAVADKLRRAAVLRDAPVPVTVSAGVATLPDCAADGAALVEVADRALYEAKRGGRDRTEQAGRRLALVAGASA